MIGTILPSGKMLTGLLIGAVTLIIVYLNLDKKTYKAK